MKSKKWSELLCILQEIKYTFNSGNEIVNEDCLKWIFFFYLGIFSKFSASISQLAKLSEVYINIGKTDTRKHIKYLKIVKKKFNTCIIVFKMK